MIEWMAGRMAEGIKRRAPDHPASVAVLRHALAVLINTISILLLSLAIGAATGKLLEVLIVLISFASLRMVSGGIHLESGTWCVIVTTVGATMISHIEMSRGWMIGLTIAAIILAGMFAPTDIQKQSRIPQEHYPKLKVISMLIIASNLIIGSSIVTASFLVQTVLLIPGRGVKNQ